MKKFISILLALMMILSMAAVASAEEAASEKVRSSITNRTGHDYYAYQIFSGTQADGKASLGQVNWGSGVNNEEIATMMSELKAVVINGSTPFSACETAEQVADVLTNSGGAAADAKNTPEALAFARIVNKYLSDTMTMIDKNSTEVFLEPGYYLLKDATVYDAENQVDDVIGLSMLQITGDEITLTSKTNKPSVVKKVQDEVEDRDMSSDSQEGWGNTADHWINESFRFRLEATIPDNVNLSEYDAYKVVFYDEMSEGITFEEIESVKINGTVIPAHDDYHANGYKLSGIVNQKWSLAIDNIKPYLDAPATADGTATAATNHIVIEVIYKAHLNENAVVAGNDASSSTVGNQNTVYLQYSNNPNAGGEGDMGKTIEDTAWVFTYALNGTKYSDDIQTGKELAGAGFTLYTAQEYAKLKANLEAVPVYLLKNEGDGYHYPVKAETENAISEIKTSSDGVFNVKGLDTGIYYLVETTIPNGYNGCKDIKVEIEADHKEELSNGQMIGKTVITMKKDDNSNFNMRIDVVNKTGATLPETGGIGTTIFYILGGILVLGAVVMLVTKKRMGAAE